MEIIHLYFLEIIHLFLEIIHLFFWKLFIFFWEIIHLLFEIIFLEIIFPNCEFDLYSLNCQFNLEIFYFL